MDFRFDTQLLIAAPKEKVFEVMTDHSQAANWMPGLVRLESFTPGPLALGSRWREVRKMFGREAGEVFEVIQIEPPKKLALRVDGTQGSTGKGEFLFDYQLSTLGNGTRLSARARVHIPGWGARLFGWMFAGTFKKAIRKDLECLKRYAESSAEDRLAS